MTEYIHGFAPEEQQRLIAQAEFWAERLITPGLPYRAGDRLLEIGCGVGAVLGILGDYVPGLLLAGIDRSEAQLHAASAHLKGRNADLRLGDARTLPWDAASFEHVYIMWVLEHVQDPLPFLVEARRVLKPGGTITIHETDYETFLSWPADPSIACVAKAQRALFADRGNAYIGRQLGASLSAAGFTNVQSTPMGFSYHQGQPELAAFVDYFLGFLEPMLPAMVSAGFDASTLEEGFRAMRNLPTLPLASLTQIVFRATGRA
ncbi:MAG: methyltransferase domain-containing protein [Myxococcota bacterium]